MLEGMMLMAALGVGPGAPPVDKSQAQAKHALLETYPDAAKMVVRQDVLESAFGLKLVRAIAEGAYPGSGVAAVLLDPATGVTYGAHGESDLADLARARGWLKKAPDAAELVKLVNAGQYAGLLIIDAQAPTVETTAAGLVLHFARDNFPSGARDRVTATFPPAGKLTVDFKPDR
jgi:hypothetical protein